MEEWKKLSAHDMVKIAKWRLLQGRWGGYGKNRSMLTGCNRNMAQNGIMVDVLWGKNGEIVKRRIEKPAAAAF